MRTGESSRISKSSKEMGTGEGNILAKLFKQTVSTQGNPTIPFQSDWPTYMQACYGTGATPTPFFTSNVATSSSLHPYMLKNQHETMQQYGSSLGYTSLYHHRGLYPNSNGAGLVIAETEQKIPNGKDLDSMRSRKRSLENAGFVSYRSGESGKAASALKNDCDIAPRSTLVLNSVPSGSEGSDESDESNQDPSATMKPRFSQTFADVSQNNVTAQYHGVNPDFVGHESNLHLGISPNASGTGGMVKKEEHDLRKERRKQSNRESAKRSRLRQQQECGKLQEAVEVLSSESSMLKDELKRLSEECLKLDDENKSIEAELKEKYGEEMISSLLATFSDSVSGGEGNSSENRTPSKSS